MKKQVILIALLVVSLLLTSGFTVVYAAPTDWGEAVTDEVLTLQNGSLTLTYERENDFLTVQDAATGNRWTNIPDATEEDELAQGSIRKEMLSSLIVSSIDGKNNNFTANSRTSCVSRGTNAVYRVGDDLVVDYDFSRNKEQYAIPVRYSVKDGTFSAEILFDEIREYGNMRICEIQLLPYFGAGVTTDDGFLLVPDGSGAIIDFGDDRSWASNYSKPVYGGDPASSDYVYSSGSQQIYMPIYGVKKGEQAFVAVLEQGDANASIQATQVGYSSSYASVAASFSYRLLDRTTLTDKYGTEKTMTFESKKTMSENPRVRFLMATPETANLAGMAARYRRYLEQTFGLSRLTEASMVYLDVYGVSQQKESFLGFPVWRSVAATTATQLTDIATALNNAGVDDGVISLYYFNKGGTGNRVQSDFELDGAVGSHREMTEALQNCRDAGFELFWGINNIRISRTSWGYWRFNAGATNMLQTTMVEYPYKMSTHSVDKKTELNFFLRPDKLQGTLSDEGVRDILDMGIDGLLLQDIGDVLYSDNKEAHYSDRATTISYYEEWLDQLSTQNEGSLLVDGANMYAALNADRVTHLPLAVSDFDICTRAVPFYSLVFHGSRAMASTPLNTTDDSHKLFLQCVLTGTAMTYNLTGQSPVVLRKTELNTLLSSDYRDWVEEIGNYYRDYREVHDDLFNSYIVDYRWEGTAEIVVYENGASIMINTGDIPQIVEGHTVPANGYVVISA